MKYIKCVPLSSSILLPQVKNHIWLFVNCLVENPTFDSQTKENMTLQQKSFGSTCPLSDKFIKQVLMKTSFTVLSNIDIITTFSFYYL